MYIKFYIFLKTSFFPLLERKKYMYNWVWFPVSELKLHWTVAAHFWESRFELCILQGTFLEWVTKQNSTFSTSPNPILVSHLYYHGDYFSETTETSIQWSDSFTQQQVIFYRPILLCKTQHILKSICNFFVSICVYIFVCVYVKYQKNTHWNVNCGYCLE